MTIVIDKESHSWEVGYDRGYEQGKIEGRVLARTEKENADGCEDCAFCKTEEWEMPCKKCRRNCRDYWRSNNEQICKNFGR